MCNNGFYIVCIQQLIIHALLRGMPEEKYAVYIIEINDWLNKLQF